MSMPEGLPKTEAVFLWPRREDEIDRNTKKQRAQVCAIHQKLAAAGASFWNGKQIVAGNMTARFYSELPVIACFWSSSSKEN